VPVDPIEVSSVAGAGDTFLSALALYLAKYWGCDLFDAVDYACMAARIAVSKRGVVAVRAEEVVYKIWKSEPLRPK
jgi:bifunctional ADP-heptose synthase (sugar kinase/adenylyltransferase)